MPQLDTIYVLTTYLWTWLMLHLITQKIKAFTMTKTPMTPLPVSKTTPVLQWL